MKKKSRGTLFRLALPCLTMAVLLTLPTAVTGSKYVWQENIQVELIINYTEQEITSLLPDGYPSEFWVWDLTHIQATATADGLVLTAEAGYTLPETITVVIGQSSYTVPTDGSAALDEIAFAPETSLLSIAARLLDENPGGVTVIAAAVPEAISDSDPLAGDAAPAEDDVPSEDDVPVEDNVPSEDDLPVEDDLPSATELAQGSQSDLCTET